jgi:chemotaxis protein histidine kinase CheA/ActR/RegA family two-component response regulator
MSTNFDKFAILDSFMDEVAAYLPEIAANLDRLQQRPTDHEAIEATYRHVHTIAGSASMMDFTDLAHVAQSLEETLGEALDGTRPLDGPTIALLRRSFGRLQRLAEQVRSGADGSPLVAEDDADRAAWRGGAAPQGAPPSGALRAAALAGPGSPSPASGLPDWLAAFGGSGAPTGPTPATAPASDPWSSSLTSLPTNQHGAVSAPGAAAEEPTFDEMLAAFQAGPGADPAIQRTAPAAAARPDVLSGGASGVRSGAFDMSSAAPPASGPSNAARALMAVSPAWEDLEINEDAVRRQVGALRDVVATLREAAQAMEDERTELHGFLDGSKEALERLEDWAGQAMGLDLRRSPDQVRRYLPLSVIWVTTTRLKKLVTLLNNSGRTLTAKQEEIQEALGELHGAIENVGRLFSSVAAVASSAGPAGAEGGFTATVSQMAQITWNPPTPAARPGLAPDAAPSMPSLPAAPTSAAGGQAEATQLPPGARAELERSVREELRREVEDEVRGEVAAEVRREEETRLRQELEIQVRRKVLSELTPGLGATAGPTFGAQGPMVPPLPLPADRAAKPVRVTEQIAETMDVFRDEAEEHLQQIALGIRQLEANPHDLASLQSVRRATHTLKGAAGMMGLTLIQHLAHASEDLLDRLVDGGLSLTPEVQGLLLDTSEALEGLVAGTVGGPEESEQLVETLQQRFAGALGRPVAPAPSVHADAPAARISAPSLPTTSTGEEDADGRRTDADLSVRLRLSKLDELVNLFGELLQNRSVLEERLGRLGRMITDTSLASQRLRDVGSQLETRFEAATLPSGRRTELGGPSGNIANSSPGLGGVRGGAVPDWGRSNGGGPGRPSPHVNEFDELELDRYTEFHRLSRGLSEGVSDMVTLSTEMESLVREVEAIFARENRLSSAFQDQLMKARLVPLQSMVPRLYRAIRAAALKQGKEVDFFVEGGDTEVDRTVYEEVAGPLLHLVRNAVVHGIERPEMRQRAGKPRLGQVVLSAANQGNQVVITVRDDGAGVDVERVRSAALARGLIDSYARLSTQEALNLLFQPGLSTSDVIDEESGRGVGLDVVRDTVARLRGTVEVESPPGEGTIFTLRIPVSLQITRAVLVRAGPQTFAVPMTNVEQIGRLDYYERARGGGPPAVEVRGQVYPLAHLATYLNLPPGPVDERSPVLLVNTGRQRMALIVEQIPGRQEVVAKSLGPHLRDVRGVAGATVLGNGQVVLILNLLEILAAPPRADAIVPKIPAPSGSAPRLPTSRTAPPETTGGLILPDVAAAATVETSAAPAPMSAPTGQPFVVAPRAERRDSSSRMAAVRPPTGGLAAPQRAGYVLVVDDSPSVRRVVSNMLKANGWEVQTARDGIEALDVVARETPAAVLLDIEMPRMDGYELMATLRSQPQYRELPLIVLTSRAATKHQQRALQLGADAYVVKPYQDEELLRTIDSLVAARRPA